MQIRYAPMADRRHADAVIAMMHALYAEDPTDASADGGRFAKTIGALLATPEKGQIILFLDAADELHGYAILIPFWSNEFGGVLVFVDELYVMPDSRRRGIGRGFLEFVARARPYEAVGIFLEGFAAE